MLYVFKNSNGLQIAWNSENPQGIPSDAPVGHLTPHVAVRLHQNIQFRLKPALPIFRAFRHITLTIGRRWITKPP